jgi:hypothetical protein
MSESAAMTIGSQTGGRWMPVLILLLGWMAAANTYQDYRTLQSLHGLNSRADGKEKPHPADVLLELRQHSLFTPYVELALARLIALDREHLQDKLVVNDAAMHFEPTADVVYRQAVLLALDGQEDAAHAQWDRSVFNYPGERPGVIKVLESMFSGDARLDELLNYARAQTSGESR